MEGTKRREVAEDKESDCWYGAQARHLPQVQGRDGRITDKKWAYESTEALWFDWSWDIDGAQDVYNETSVSCRTYTMLVEKDQAAGLV